MHVMVMPWFTAEVVAGGAGSAGGGDEDKTGINY